MDRRAHYLRVGLEQFTAHGFHRITARVGAATTTFLAAHGSAVRR